MDIKYSDEQQRIINDCNKNLLITAGPGSGKSTLLGGIADKLLSTITNKILLLTFTNKASKSIINKVKSLDQNRIKGGTFHKISYEIIKSTEKKSNICDENKKRLIIKKLFNCKSDQEKFDNIYKHISRCKSIYPIIKSDTTNLYNEELDKYDMVDFDDLINLAIDILKSGYKTDYTFILVDELQDTSSNQLVLLEKLKNSTICKIIGVCDEDQIIYEWRQAKPENIWLFKEKFNCSLVELGVNFRSKINIVKHSKNLISYNKNRTNKNLRSNYNDLGLVSSIKRYDAFAEMDTAVSICKSNKNRKIAILYRDRRYKSQLEYTLRKNNIEYTVNDSNSIVDRSPFRILIAMLKIASGKYDIYDIEEASKGMKYIGKTTIKKIKSLIDEGNNIYESIEQLNSKTRTKNNVSCFFILQDCFKNNTGKKIDSVIPCILENIIESCIIPDDISRFITDIAKMYDVSINSVINLCNDFGLDNNEEDQEEKNIILSTLHGWKGMEQDIVVMLFCNWRFTPDENTRDIIEAERRLFYVGMTRAKSCLYLTYNGQKPRFIIEAKL